MQRLCGAQVLIVEDEFFIAEELACALAEEGAQVVGPVGSVAEALDIITRQPHLDGAVLDIALRRETVYPVAALLRRRAVPFVFLTGCDKAAVAADFCDVPLIGKPSDTAAVVAGLLGLRSSG